MAAFGLQRTGDVVAVMLKDRIIRFAHVRIPMTGATNGFRGLSTRHGGYGRPRTSGGRRTRWDRVRLNRLVGSIPVAPTLALAGPACDASQGDLLITPQWVLLQAASPSPVRDPAAGSDPACFLDAARQVLGPVQKVEGGEVIGTAMIVLAALARPVHQPGTVTGCRLARLNVHVIGVHRDLSRQRYRPGLNAGHMPGSSPRALARCLSCRSARL